MTDYAVPVYSKAERSRFLDELDSVAKEGKPIIVPTSASVEHTKLPLM